MDFKIGDRVKRKDGRPFMLAGGPREGTIGEIREEKPSIGIEGARLPNGNYNHHGANSLELVTSSSGLPKTLKKSDLLELIILGMKSANPTKLASPRKYAKIILSDYLTK